MNKNPPPEKYFSASEINRFRYCPWQWYYGRVYGAKALDELRRERNRALGLPENTGAGTDAFARGRVFHRNFRRNYILKQAVKWVAIFLLAAVLCCFIKFTPSVWR
jgi:hypothetical protein